MAPSKKKEKISEAPYEAPYGTTAKARHQRDARNGNPSGPAHHQRDARNGNPPGPAHVKKPINWEEVKVPPGLRMRIKRAEILHNTKHETYLEFVKNEDKKKKLEFQTTNLRQTPAGFRFIPIKKTELTKACKELSRERDAMVMIVSDCDTETLVSNPLSVQANRIGYYVRQTIVEEAQKALGDTDDLSVDVAAWAEPEPVPISQEKINQEADESMLGIFPRIPNAVRYEIIQFAFRKNACRVGVAPNLSLAKRVQFAVIAYVRHKSTSYDELLPEYDWRVVRKAVLPEVLKKIIEWRGDDENGRDQQDEVVREVVVLSDSDDNGNEGVDADNNKGKKPIKNKELEGHGPSPIYSQDNAADLSGNLNGPLRNFHQVRPHIPKSKRIGRIDLRSPSQYELWSFAASRGRECQAADLVEKLRSPSGVITLQGQPYQEISSHVGENEASTPRGALGALAQPAGQYWPCDPPSCAPNPEQPSRSSADHTPQVVQPSRLRHEDLKDYLIPSIEGSASDFDPSEPRFVRQVPVLSPVGAMTSTSNQVQGSPLVEQGPPRMSSMSRLTLSSHLTRPSHSEIRAVYAQLPTYPQLPAYNGRPEQNGQILPANFQNPAPRLRARHDAPGFVGNVPRQNATSSPAVLNSRIGSSNEPAWQSHQALHCQPDYGQATSQTHGTFGPVTQPIHGAYGQAPHQAPVAYGQGTYQAAGAYSQGADQVSGAYPQPPGHTRDGPRNFHWEFDI